MFFETFGLFAVLIFLLYKWIYRKANFFDGTNIKHDKFFPFLGSFKDLLLGRKSMQYAVINLYNKFEGEKVAGVFDNNTPVYLVRDPDLIKQITVKEFDHFMNHKVSRNKNGGLFGLSVFSMTNQKWRDMRATLSPAFTGSKMRLMFDLIKEVSEQSVNYLKKRHNDETDLVIEMRDFFNRFMNDAIATTAFGIKTDSLENPNNTFFKMGTDVIKFTFFKLQFLFFFNFKIVSKFLNMRIFNKKYDDYFMNLVIDNMNYRKKNNIVRNDVINILMDAKGMSVSENPAKQIREWTDEEIVAQSFVFFFGGLDTVSQALSFLTYELMINQDVQKRVSQEIEEVKNCLNGEPLTYEYLSKMKYTDAAIDESLRKWSNAPLLDRLCTKDFTLKDDKRGDIEIKEGNVIMIPVAGIHNDPKYYPDPEIFNPERFIGSNSAANESCYMPFGEGPRKCIANRFALMEIKTSIYYLLANFNIQKSPKTVVPLELTPGFQLNAKHGFWVKLVPK